MSDHVTPLATAGTSLLPTMAFFGSTATKESLYDYTVKDAGEPNPAESISGDLSKVTEGMQECSPALFPQIEPAGYVVMFARPAP